MTPPPSPARIRRLLAAGQLEAGLELLTARLESLARKVGEGDESAWPLYLVTMQTLTAVLDHLQPEREAGDYLTTKQLAEKLGMRPDSLLRRRRRGQVMPTIAKGKLIRWRLEDGL